MVLLMCQALAGYYYHRFVQEKPRKRRWLAHFHIWLGRVVIALGFAECGLGMNEACVDREYAVVWWIATGFIGGMYAGACVWQKFILPERHERISAPVIRRQSTRRYYNPDISNISMSSDTAEDYLKKGGGRAR